MDCKYEDGNKMYHTNSNYKRLTGYTSIRQNRLRVKNSFARGKKGYYKTVKNQFIKKIKQLSTYVPVIESHNI